MDEASLLAAVCYQMGLRNLIWHHCRRPHHACDGHAGFPDLIIFGTALITRELKGDGTRTPAHQSGYGQMLRLAGISWAIWTPADLESGLIAAQLDQLMC